MEPCEASRVSETAATALILRAEGFCGPTSSKISTSISITNFSFAGARHVFEGYRPTLSHCLPGVLPRDAFISA